MKWGLASTFTTAEQEQTHLSIEFKIIVRGRRLGTLRHCLTTRLLAIASCRDEITIQKDPWASQAVPLSCGTQQVRHILVCYTKEAWNDPVHARKNPEGL